MIYGFSPGLIRTCKSIKTQSLPTLYSTQQISQILPFLALLCWKLFQVTSKGEAKKIEEYVPAIIPMMSASEKYLVDWAPRKYSETKTIKTVSEVLMERVIVWFKDFPTTSSKDSFLARFKFSRMRS